MVWYSHLVNVVTSYCSCLPSLVGYHNEYQLAWKDDRVCSMLSQFDGGKLLLESLFFLHEQIP